MVLGVVVASTAMPGVNAVAEGNPVHALKVHVVPPLLLARNTP
jgi:hypothetical protein